MIRVVLPAHLRTLARVDGEVKLDVAAPAGRVFPSTPPHTRRVWMSTSDVSVR